jgi:soluble lytic murein transglycosylase-like protein
VQGVRRPVIAAAIAAAACAPGLACGGSTASTATSGSGATAAASAPTTLAQRLTAADAGLQASLGSWRASDPSLLGHPPPAALAAAARERTLVHLLAQHPALARRALAALSGRLRATVRCDLVAARDLRRLTGPPSASPLRLVPAVPAGQLRADYRLAQRRFGVPWQVLAAVNLVESAFGRVVNRSSAGARGPMQFLPSTWRAYGLGGNVSSPHDAILGAANYLHRSGAPRDERRALHAYNPSRLYVDAVLAYARVMSRDPLGYLTYYAWEASLPARL